MNLMVNLACCFMHPTRRVILASMKPAALHPSLAAAVERPGALGPGFCHRVASLPPGLAHPPGLGRAQRHPLHVRLAEALRG
jgi:hypothetical protein